MYFKIIIISTIVVAVWVNAIQPMINEWLFERAMKKDDDALQKEKDCKCSIANYRKKYFNETKSLVIK